MLLTKIKILYIVIALTFFVLNIHGQTINTIDATSSASKKYVVTGGKVDEKSATIRWQSKYNNGELEIKWGTNLSNLSNSKSMYPYTRGTTAEIILDNLKPGTKYYYRVDGVYKGKVYNSLVSGSFNTVENKVAAITSFMKHHTIPQAITVYGGALRTNLLFIPGDIVTILDSKGTFIKKISVHSFCRETDISFLGNGHYIFNLMRNNKLIHQIHGAKL